jgi:hypothetical protein
MTDSEDLKHLFRRELNNNDLICTPLEVKIFAFNSQPTAWNMQKWIESKSYEKYTVVKTEYIKEALDLLTSIEEHIFKKEVAEIVVKLMQYLSFEAREEYRQNYYNEYEVF